MFSTAKNSRGNWLLCAFLFGFVSLVYEVYSLKVVFFYFTENSHAMAVTLSSFLAGLAFSSLVFSKIIHKNPEKSESWLILLQIMSVAYALIVLRNFFIIPEMIDWISQNIVAAPGLVFIAKIVIIWIFLFIPAFLLGGGFPIINGLYLKDFESRFKDTGVVYFWDTCGAIAGSLVGGFFLIPACGLVKSLYIPSLISCCIIFWLLKNTKQRCVFLAVCLTAGIGLSIFENSRISNSSPAKRDLIPYERRFGQIIFQEHSPFGIVTIGNRENPRITDRGLFINYREMCSSADNISEKEIGSLTAENLSPSSRVMNIGLGCGFTAQALNESPNVEMIDVIEINPAVIAGASRYFAEFNGDILKSRKITLTQANGAEIIRNNKDIYDAIVIDIEEPGVIQSSPMYTLEYFQMAQQRLKPGGIFTIWAIKGNASYNQILDNTLKRVFRHVYFRGKTTVQFYASDRELNITENDRTGWKKNFETINTLDNRALEKSYSIRESFNLPVWHKDPFIQE